MSEREYYQITGENIKVLQKISDMMYNISMVDGGNEGLVGLTQSIECELKDILFYAKARKRATDLERKFSTNE